MRILLLAVGLWIFTPSMSLATGARPLAERVQALVADFMSSGSTAGQPAVPAMSVAIGRDGNVLFADGFGEARTGVPATSRTIYMVGSLTKQFTAAAILRLMEKHDRAGLTGKELSPSLPVADVLRVADAWAIEGGPPITVSHLLSMTSNLPNFTRKPPRQLDPWGSVPARKLLGELGDFRPSGYPGEFEYSNTSYFLLAEIMEAVELAGHYRSYRQTLNDEIFARLGMTQTGFASDPKIVAALADPHFTRPPPFAAPDWLKGSADVASSVMDLFRWNTALMTDEVLTPTMRDLMLSDQARVDVWTYYGMGWFITHKGGMDRYFHTGTVSGFTSFNLIVKGTSKSWISVSLLANCDGLEGISDLGEKLAALALETD
ncbi:hypothetical protein DLM45_03675 [Hyphomicrobium methylovorum]|uniref:serine hydrolase domain-containing protein n=1 Tax=Hyphomicrobium methylovorum TaxID=84 RepID=UPI0015E6D6A3|nr:serine hydrolase domain-containing protein [Hyphomicrobium methylovorum]MBA2125323.1 hypothetical protein [Hyphomicrobium methylovorum]